MITLKIDVTKIDKSLLFKGSKGTYLDLVLFENKDGVGTYGDTHFVTQNVSKEQREKGVRGPIVGNAKVTDTPSRGQRREAPRSESQGDSWSGTEDMSDVPF